MTDTILLVAAGVGGLVALLGLGRSITFGERKYCPGPRRPLVEWLWPPNWFAAIGCGYDLTGHLLDSKSGFPVRCSECGRSIPRRRQLQRKPRRWRFIRTGFFLTMTASIVLVQRFFAQPHWDDDLPTWALVTIERWFGESTPIGVSKELRQRLWKMTPDQWISVHTLLLRDLRSDSVNYNAEQASELLRRIESATAREALRGALLSDDWQQRQLSAMILCDQSEPPTSDLLKVLLEALRYDREAGYYRTDRRNASNAIAYLREHAEAVTPLLRSALILTDYQQQQIAARLLCEFDEPPASRLLDALVIGFRQPEARYEYEVSDLLFNQGLGRLVDYLGRHRSETEPFLRRCLRDEQGAARAFAACLLREISPDRDQELLGALVDALRFNHWPGEWYWNTRFLIKRTVAYLIDAGPEAADALRLAMQSDDPQQRLLAAATAGFAELQNLAPLAAPILVEHLSDNRIGDDAVYAVRALLGFGRAARPWLEPLSDSDDKQIRGCVAYLMARIDGQRAVLPSRKLQWGYTGLLTSRTNDPGRLNWDQFDVPRIDPDRFPGR